MDDSIAINADCVEGMKGIEDDSIDLTVTSPPYDSIRTYKGFCFDYKETLRQLYRITKPGGVVVWIVADQTVNGNESGTSFKQALFAQECGFNLHDTMIWNKQNLTFPHPSLYFDCFEYMFIFVKGKIKTYNLIEDRINTAGGEKMRGTSRQPDGSLTVKNGAKVGRLVKEIGRRFNVWDIPPVMSNTERTGHPAQFPLRLVKDHIKSWSNEGDIVCDPFLGSGTTRIAAYDMNRKFIGFEISEEYFKLQEERFRNHTAQYDLFH